MLYGLHSMTSVPNTPWENLFDMGKIFFSRSSHAQFLGDLIIPRAGMDFETFDYLIQAHLQMYLQRTLTEGAFSTQDHGQRGLMFSIKQLKRNLTQLGALPLPDLLQNESKFPASSCSCSPCRAVSKSSLPPIDEGARWRKQSPVDLQGTLPVPSPRMVQNRFLSEIEMSAATTPFSTASQRVAERAVDDSSLQRSKEDKTSNIINIMSKVIDEKIDEKLTSLEARMIENIGRLLQAVNNNVVQEQQVRHSSFPPAERERPCSCKMRAIAFQLTPFALCTLCLSFCLRVCLSLFPAYSWGPIYPLCPTFILPLV